MNIKLRILSALVFVSTFGFGQGYIGGGLNFSVDGKGKVNFSFTEVIDCKACVIDCNTIQLEITSPLKTYTHTFKLESEVELTHKKCPQQCSVCEDETCNRIIGLLKRTYTSESLYFADEFNQGICEINAKVFIGQSAKRLDNIKPYHKLIQRVKLNICQANTSPQFDVYGITPRSYSQTSIHLEPIARIDEDKQDSFHYELIPITDEEIENII